MAVENYLSYNAYPSVANKIYISGVKAFRTAERDYEKIEIPGRNGFLLQDNGRFKPVVVEYDAFVVDNSVSNYLTYINKISSNFGLHRLFDTYDNYHYRMGIFAGGVDPNIFAMKTVRFTMRFICQPERWLYTGETETTYTASSNTIVNPTYFPAKPLLHIVGNGTVTLGGVTITVAGNSGYIDLDCETGDAYEVVSGTLYYRNDKLTIPNHEMPSLVTGNNTLALSGVTSVKVRPRWWEL